MALQPLTAYLCVYMQSLTSFLWYCFVLGLQVPSVDAGFCDCGHVNIIPLVLFVYLFFVLWFPVLHLLAVHVLLRLRVTTTSHCHPPHNDIRCLDGQSRRVQEAVVLTLVAACVRALACLSV